MTDVYIVVCFLILQAGQTSSSEKVLGSFFGADDVPEGFSGRLTLNVLGFGGNLKEEEKTLKVLKIHFKRG